MQELKKILRKSGKNIQSIKKIFTTKIITIV